MTSSAVVAKAFGAQVFATAGSAEECAACEQLGATRAMDLLGQTVFTEETSEVN